MRERERRKESMIFLFHLLKIDSPDCCIYLCFKKGSGERSFQWNCLKTWAIFPRWGTETTWNSFTNRNPFCFFFKVKGTSWTGLLNIRGIKFSKSSLSFSQHLMYRRLWWEGRIPVVGKICGLNWYWRDSIKMEIKRPWHWNRRGSWLFQHAV